jgi:putative flippase GtrA
MSLSTRIARFVGARRAFWRFAGIAGCGWLLDACLLMALVGALGVPPAGANVVSSCVAAVTVFLVARQTIFDKADRALPMRVAVYVIYTLIVIAIASFFVGLITNALDEALPAAWWPSHRVVASAAIAKIVVTPPQLLLNFFVSRFLSERRIAPAS